MGPLRPATVNRKTGRIIDGACRLAAVPEWPIEYVDVDELTEEVQSLHANVQDGRPVSQDELSMRIGSICALLNKLEDIPAEKCLKTAYERGYLPFPREYAYDLCPRRFRETELEDRGEFYLRKPKL